MRRGSEQNAGRLGQQRRIKCSLLKDDRLKQACSLSVGKYNFEEFLKLWFGIGPAPSISVDCSKEKFDLKAFIQTDVYADGILHMNIITKGQNSQLVLQDLKIVFSDNSSCSFGFEKQGHEYERNVQNEREFGLRNEIGLNSTRELGDQPYSCSKLPLPQINWKTLNSISIKTSCSEKTFLATDFTAKEEFGGEIISQDVFRTKPIFAVCSKEAEKEKCSNDIDKIFYAIQVQNKNLCDKLNSTKSVSVCKTALDSGETNQYLWYTKYFGIDPSQERNIPNYAKADITEIKP